MTSTASYPQLVVPRMSPLAQAVLQNTNVPFYSEPTPSHVKKPMKGTGVKAVGRGWDSGTPLREKVPILPHGSVTKPNVNKQEPQIKPMNGHSTRDLNEESRASEHRDQAVYNGSHKKENIPLTKVKATNLKPLTPPRNPSSDPVSTSSIAIELPRASEVIRTEEYTRGVNEPKSAREDYGRDASPGINLDGHDTRQQAEDAFEALQECMTNIFASEDNPNANSSLCAVIGEETFSLTSSALSNVQTLLQKIIGLGRYEQVPVDDLVRLQKLLDGAIRAADTTNLRFDDSWNEFDLEEYLRNVHVASIGLKSARTALRIMSGGREDKQLYSEELIHACVGSLNNVLDASIIPIVELRDSGSTSTIFKLLGSKKKVLRDLLLQCQRMLTTLRDLVSKVELSETVINSLEYTVSRLIFVENAPIERDSVLGIGKFDNIRVVAMDTLAQIFSSHTEQRKGIFAEILTSLEKLPVAKQSARQFKLVTGGSIQLVSALIMRLIQTSGNKSDAKSRRHALPGDADADGEDEDGPQFQVVIGGGLPPAYDTESRALRNPPQTVHDLENIAQPLLETAKSSASYVVNFIVHRAMNSTKTGDTPYRNLLDLFVQDFITCLSSSDWPAAELLLRMFVISMISLGENDKTPGAAKNMALEILGEIGAAISQLTSSVKRMAAAIEADGLDDDVSKHLLLLVETFNEDKLNVHDVVPWNGPYHLALSYLDSRYANDFTLQSAVGYCTADWASHVCEGYAAIVDEQDREMMEPGYGRLAYRLRMMLNDKKWLSAENSGFSGTATHAHLAYALTLLNSRFCRAFNRILMILLNSTDSDQAMVRSKGLKSFNLLLETDPTILDRGKNVIRIVLSRSNDPSVAVRDSALGLIAKCIGLRPALESESLPAILRAAGDSSVSVRKRAIKLLKDVYLRNNNKDLRTNIADALLHRAKDPDDTVQELARQVIEEVWMSPFFGLSAWGELSIPNRLAIADHVGLMIQTVQRSSDVSVVLDKVLHSSLASTSKNSAANFKVCKIFVGTMFETIIGGPGMGATNRLESKDALQLLMTFAKASPKLFTTDQIQLLEPYIADVKTEADIAIFRPVIVIFRHVFPELSTLHTVFLTSVRTSMIKTITRMPRMLLDDIFACLRIMSEVLENNDQLVRLMGSTIDPIRKFTKVNFSDPKRENDVKKITRLFLITGMCGKHCDLDNQVAFFQQKFPEWKGSSVAKLMVDSFAPFASPSQNLEIRRAALDAIGLVCQTWPKNYNTVAISTVFQAAFEDNIEALEAVIMRSFKEFFTSEETRSDPNAEPSVGANADTPATLGVMGGSQHDGVSASIHHKFMQYMTDIALSSEGDHALLATEILTSINRQGLNHPKECGPTFVALETSRNPKIADLAFKEHRSIQEKHETIMEKELMRAVQQAFSYQQKVVKDTRGAIPPQTGSMHIAKLHLLLEVMNISKVKMRKRFYENLCTRVDFGPSKLDVSGELPRHVEFSRFVIENLAFFEFSTMDELLTAISAMEKVVAGTGTSLAHAIETEIFSLGIENIAGAPADRAHAQNAVKPVDPARLRQLGAGSMVLSCMWEARTHLRRLYGLMNKEVGGRRESKAKVNVKDLTKAPTKAPFANGDKFWDESTRIMSALGSQELMIEQCKAFVELLTVDKDFKIAAEGEGDIAARARLTTPSDDETVSQPGSGRSRKRRAGTTPGGRKKRARSNSRSRGGRRRSSNDSGDGDYE